MPEDFGISKREYIHTNNVKYKFQLNTFAPIPKEKGGSGKTRFSVEDMVYITGVGYDIVDMYNTGNEYYLALYKYIEGKEENKLVGGNP